MGIRDDARRVFAFWNAAGEERIIGKDRSDACHDGGIAIAIAMHVLPRCFSGNPLRISGIGGDFTIHGHGVFHYHIRCMVGDIVEEYAIQPVARLF